MTWTFNPADFKTVYLKNTVPGDILCTIRQGGPCELWLRLVNEDSNLLIVYLNGPKSYEVRELTSSTEVSVLRIAEGKNLRLEIQEKYGISSFEDEPGQLYIADSGPYLVAQFKEDYGSMDSKFVSLQTWQTNTAGRPNFKGSFSTWKLVDVSDPNNKQTLLSVGDGNDA